MANDHRERLAIIAALSDAFGREMSDPALELYLSALADVPLRSLQRAAGECMRTSRFMPSAAELRDAAGAGKRSDEVAAVRAWEVAVRAVEEHGAYVSVRFEDSTTARTIAAMGGWVAFCRPSQAVEWQRKEFLETYRDLRDAPGDVPTLRGLHGRAPVLVGGGVLAEKLIAALEEDAPASKVEAVNFGSELKRRLRGAKS